MCPDVSDPAWRKAREKAWKRVWKLNKMDNSTREARDWLFGIFMGDREYEFEPEPWDYTKHYGPADHHRAFHFSPFQSIELWRRYIEKDGPCYLCEKLPSEIDRMNGEAMKRGAARLSRDMFCPSLDMTNHYGWERETAIMASRWMYGERFDPEYTGHGMSIAYPARAEELVSRFCSALSCWGVLLATPEDSTILDFVDFFVSALPYVSPVMFHDGRSRVFQMRQYVMLGFVRNATGGGRKVMEKCRKSGVANESEVESFLRRERIMSEIVIRMRDLNIDYINDFIDRHEGREEMAWHEYKSIAQLPRENDVPADYLKF